MFPVSEGSIVEFLLEGEARVGVVVELEQGKSLVQVACLKTLILRFSGRRAVLFPLALQSIVLRAVTSDLR
jgi:hypothetical protein